MTRLDTAPSPLQRLVDHLLPGQSLDKFVTERRAAGVSWRHIAKDIEAATGEDLAPTTLSGWYPGT